MDAPQYFSRSMFHSLKWSGLDDGLGSGTKSRYWLTRAAAPAMMEGGVNYESREWTWTSLRTAEKLSQEEYYHRTPNYDDFHEYAILPQ